MDDDIIAVAKDITSQYIELNDADLQLFATTIDAWTHLSKGEVFIPEGTICRHLIYVREGLVRQFYYKGGHDVTEQFSSGGSLMYCIESLFNKEPTHLMAEALEPSDVYYINYAKFCQLTEQSVGICRLYRKFQEGDSIISQHKADDLRFESARERYNKFLKYFPDAARRAPLQHIASYLCITQETLSRIRNGSRR